MSSSNCCFLTYIQISQEAGQVVWYSHLFQNFPQFIVIHIVKGFGIVNEAEIDVFLELSKHTERFLFQDLGLPLDFMSLGSPKYKTQSFAFFSVVQDTEMNRGSKKYKMQLYPKPQ